MFEIRFDAAGCDERVAAGTIVLASFQETFLAPLHVWSRSKYESHWIQAIDRILGGSRVAALITEMYDPLTANFIKWWPIYRFGNEVRFHNQLLLLAELRSPLVPEDLFEHVPPYQQVNEDGDLLSEWSVSVRSLYRFRRRVSSERTGDSAGPG